MREDPSSAPMDTSKCERFLFACKNGRKKEVLEYLIEDENISNEATNENGWTGLMYAARGGHSQTTSLLLEHNAKFTIDNQSENSGCTALICAAHQGNIEVVQILLQAGARKEIKDKQKGITAVMHAAHQGHVEVVVELVSAGCSINTVDKDGWSILMYAASKGRSEVVRSIISLLEAETRQINLNTQSKDGVTALICAAHQNQTEIVKILLEAGADFELRDKCGEPSLWPQSLVIESPHPYSAATSIFPTEECAVAAQDFHSVDMAGVDTYRVSFAQDLNPGRQFLDYLVLFDDDSMTCSSGDSGAYNMEAVDADEGGVEGGVEVEGERYINSHDISLYNAIAYNNDTVRKSRSQSQNQRHSQVHSLQNTCVDTDKHRHRDKVTMSAPEQGDSEKLQFTVHARRFCIHFQREGYLDSWGYCVRISPMFSSDPDLTGWTALMWAAHKGYYDVLNTLLSHGAKTDVRSWTALTLAIEGGHETCAISLVKYRSRLDYPDKDNATSVEKALAKNLRSVISEALHAFQPLPEQHQLQSQTTIKHLNEYEYDNNGNINQNNGHTNGHKSEYNNLNGHSFIHSNEFEFEPGAAYLWTFVLSSTEGFEDEIEGILLRYRSRINLLINVTVNNKGTKAIDIATMAYRPLLLEYLFFKRYQIKEGPPRYVSNDRIIYRAIDYKYNDKNKNDYNDCNSNSSSSTNFQEVDLYFIKDKEHFQQELKIYHMGLDKKYILEILNSYDTDENPLFKDQTIELNVFPYCLVMPAIETDLTAIISHHTTLAKNWKCLHEITKQMIESIDYIHNNDIIHGNIHPNNFVRINERILLRNFTNSKIISQYKNNDLRTLQSPLLRQLPLPLPLQSIYMAPEMVVVAVETEEGQQRKIPMSPSRGGGEGEGIVTTTSTSTLTLPSGGSHIFSHDIWCLGVTLYHLYTNKNLFATDDKEEILPSEYIHICNWTDSIKSTRLSHVYNVPAKNLLYQLLRKKPSDRPTTDVLLSHSFLLGGKATGWDEERFCQTCIRCRIFVPLLSRETITSTSTTLSAPAAVTATTSTATGRNWMMLKSHSSFDRFLFELRFGLEMRDIGLIESIFPIVLGDSKISDVITDIESLYFIPYKIDSYTLPNEFVLTIENKLMETMSRLGLGSPLVDRQEATVRWIIQRILENKGTEISGHGLKAFHKVCDELQKVLEDLSDSGIFTCGNDKIRKENSSQFASCILRFIS
eukprot:gene4491-8935_t